MCLFQNTLAIWKAFDMATRELQTNIYVSWHLPFEICRNLPRRSFCANPTHEEASAFCAITFFTPQSTACERWRPWLFLHPLFDGRHSQDFLLVKVETRIKHYTQLQCFSLNCMRSVERSLCTYFWNWSYERKQYNRDGRDCQYQSCGRRWGSGFACRQDSKQWPPAMVARIPYQNIWRTAVDERKEVSTHVWASPQTLLSQVILKDIVQPHLCVYQ